MARRRKESDHRADTDGKGWVGIPQVVIDSVAYQNLSRWARVILVEITRRFNGFNNGSIGMSQRELGARLGSQNWKMIGRGIAELVDHGFLDVSAEGLLQEKRAREYRLTFVSTTDRYGRSVAATNEYRHWRK